MSGSSAGSKSVLAMDQSTVAAYLGMLALVSLVYQSFHDLGLSTLLTLSVGMQCFAYACLLLKVCNQNSVAGISGRALALQAISYSLRLSSTTWLKGYIPVDGTGDWLYQVLDVSALLMALKLIHCVYKTHRSTYQEDCDGFNVVNTAIVCFVLAVVIHPDLNARPVFDTLWTTALYIDVVAMVPQLWMMSKIGGEVDARNCHYVGATALSRCVNLIFWFYGFRELAPLDGSANITGWVIMTAHIIQMLLLCDFLALYVKACLKSGFSATVLPIHHDV